MVNERDDEFAEIDLTEQEIDAMIAGGEPVQIVAFPPPSGPLYSVVTSSPHSLGGPAGVIVNPTYAAPSISVVGGQTSGAR